MRVACRRLPSTCAKIVQIFSFVSFKLQRGNIHVLFIFFRMQQKRSLMRKPVILAVHIGSTSGVRVIDVHRVARVDAEIFNAPIYCIEFFAARS